MDKKNLKEEISDAAYIVTQEHGTEAPFSGDLLDLKEKGVFSCICCGNNLFSSDTKYDSGTGWPSFFDYYKGSIETKIDYKLIYPRVEYRCAVCEGHHGHVFDDGPKPTFKRYCNNGKVLKFFLLF